MDKLRQAAQQALEALEANLCKWEEKEKAVHILRAALAEPEQEPDGISWLKRDGGYFTAPTPRKPNLEALNAELLEALRGTVAEMLSVLDALNNERMPHDGDEFHERLEKARATLAKVEISK